MNELREILENAQNGNWSSAIEDYKNLDMTGQELGWFLERWSC